MRWDIIVYILLLSVGIAVAYKTGGSFFVINSTTENFTTPSTVLQHCNMLNGSGINSCIFEWAVNATGKKALYQLRANFSTTDNNVTMTDADRYFNVTIFDKGNGSSIIPNYSCEYCSFQVVDSVGTGATLENPRSIGLMGAGTNTTIQWNISAQGALNTTWDVFAIVNYTAAGWRDASTNRTKVRIAEYPWQNTSFNCRRLINVTQNTANNGSGIVEIRRFDLSAGGSCDVFNCTKEIRITEVTASNLQEYTPYLLIENVTMLNSTDNYTYCSKTNIKFNTTLVSGQTKQFFVYYNSPLAEADYSSINQTHSNISQQDFTEQYPIETVWDEFYDSHLDFWWNVSTDLVSKNARNSTNITKKYMQNMSYAPQVYSNRRETKFSNRIHLDTIYWIFTHGFIYQTPAYNETAFTIRVANPSETIPADEVSDLSNNLSTKFVMVIASFSGDNSTTLTNCPLGNWLSKAFTEKGAACYLSFLGRNTTTVCPTDCSSCSSDTFTPDVDQFNECFWGNISAGIDITNAVIAADSCAKTCGPNNNESCTNPVLVENYTNSCKINLLK